MILLKSMYKIGHFDQKFGDTEQNQKVFADHSSLHKYKHVIQQLLLFFLIIFQVFVIFFKVFRYNSWQWQPPLIMGRVMVFISSVGAVR